MVDELRNQLNKDRSHIILYRSDKKTIMDPFGFPQVDTISPDGVAMIDIGGNATIGPGSAHGNVRILKTILDHHHIPRELVGLFAAQYQFKSNDKGGLSRAKFFHDHSVPCDRRYDYQFTEKDVISTDLKTFEAFCDPITEEMINPNYAKELFKKVFLPRICDRKGERLSFDEARRRIRNLTVCVHCHGAYTFLKIEEMMQQKMAEVGYSPKERAALQKQLLCLACAPDVPLGISKSTMISFASQRDPFLLVNNNFRLYIDLQKEDQRLPTAYFPGKQGEVLLAKQLFKSGDVEEEHNFLCLEDWKSMTADGRILLGFFSNAIANSLASALRGEPLPSIQELFCNDADTYWASFPVSSKGKKEKKWPSISKLILDQKSKSWPQQALEGVFNKLTEYGQKNWTTITEGLRDIYYPKQDEQKQITNPKNTPQSEKEGK